MPQSSIREARIEDFKDFQELIKEYCDEFKYSYDPVSVSKYIYIGLQHTTTLVAEVNNKVIGVLNFIVSPHQFTGILCARKMAWFVTKEHRGKVGLQLLRKAEEQAKSMGATQFYCSTQTKMFTDYMPLETEYVKDLI
jgi:N-acetylglutamate synthase-like GNAT family acetyltransferase